MKEMTETKEAMASTSDRELVFTRVFDAPRELVFHAWTDPRIVGQWWGPYGFTTTTHEMDVRPGGVWRLTMHGPDGRDYRNKIVFLEVVKPSRLVYKHDPERGTEPVNFETTVTFAERGDKTELTMRMLFPSAAAREYVIKTYGAEEGAKQTLSRLGEHLAKLWAQGPVAGEFSIVRKFDAPRELVFKAWTESERLAHWWGPKGYRIRIAKLDFRPGGVFHYSMTTPSGDEWWGKFVYREIVPPERLVFVNSFSDAQGGVTRAPMSPTFPLEILSTITFTEHDGRTTVTLRGVPLNASEEESKTFAGMRESMQKGWTGTMNQLAEYLAKA
jgi:uncharacterized protein YndB with AHSA1/START domain